MQIGLPLREVGQHMAMTQRNKFNLHLLVHFHDALETLSKEKFPSHLQILPIPKSTFSMSSSTSSTEWSPSPFLEEGQSSQALEPPNANLGALSEDNPSQVSSRSSYTMSPNPSQSQTLEVVNKNAPEPGSPSTYALPNSAPLLDSRVYVFYSPSGSDDEFDFACKGQGQTPWRDYAYVSSEFRTLPSGRPRAWSNHDRRLSALPDRGSPRGPTAITSEHTLRREKKHLAQISPRSPRTNGHVRVRCSPLHDKVGRSTRVSNKWGKHPPAGYF